MIVVGTNDQIEEKTIPIECIRMGKRKNLRGEE